MVIIEEGAIKPDITGCDECGKETRCIEFKGGGYLYCLTCLRAAVALLEGQEGESEEQKSAYTGPINNGDAFVWMHGTNNEERITVLEQRNGWIKSRGSRRGECWNSEDVFRESVTQREPKPSKPANWGALLAPEHRASILHEAMAFEKALNELRALSGVDHDDLKRIITEHMRRGPSWRDVIAYLREQIMKDDYRWLEEELPPS